MKREGSPSGQEQRTPVGALWQMWLQSSPPWRQRSSAQRRPSSEPSRQSTTPSQIRFDCAAKKKDQRNVNGPVDNNKNTSNEATTNEAGVVRWWILENSTSSSTILLLAQWMSQLVGVVRWLTLDQSTLVFLRLSCYLKSLLARLLIKYKIKRCVVLW